MAVAIDFETFYSKDCDIHSLGPYHYLNDPKCEVYLVSIASSDGFRWVGSPDEFDWKRLDGCFLVAHNLSWDGLVFAHLVRKGLIPKDVQIAGAACTANLACYCGAQRSLKEAAHALLGVDVSKDERQWMRGKTWAEAVAAGKAEDIKAYALRDAEVCLALWEKFSDRWPEQERELAHRTMLCGWKGVRIDTTLVEASIATLQRVMFEAAAKIPWANGEDASVLSPKALGEQCRAQGITPPPSLAEDDPGCEAWERRHGEQFPWVAAMRDYRKANILLRKFQTMRDRTRSTDGCMGFGLKYFGSHTGRWSGDSGFNIQNLHREQTFGVDLRRCIVARPGRKFVISDLSQIEPRVMAWLSGDEALLEQLRRGVPLYEAHARQTMGWTGGSLKKENPRLYALAKARVLGLGYGCGPDKFITVARTMGGIDLSLPDARATVTAFRQSNRRIIELWNRLGTDFNRSVQDGTYEIGLPSGRTLTYFNVSSHGCWTCQTQLGGPKVRMYGGKLVENLVQAVARDVFAEALLRLDRAGIEVVFHCHDEVVCEVPIDTQPADIERLMSITPDWLPGCPLAAESVQTGHYLK
jgi:DNA polymerase